MADKSKSIMKKPDGMKSEPMDLDDLQSNESDGETEHGMRVGEEYQAVVPDVIIEKDKYEPSHKALLVWSPNANISDQKLDEYLQRAKDKHGYNMEQALGMLFWHKHNIDRSLTDLANFTPFPDEWSMEDKVLFEQAFNSHGKSFKKLQQSLQDKPVSSLVKFYYSWKKTRTRTSLIDRQAKRVALQRDQSDNESDKSDTSDSDFEPEKEGRSNGGIKRSLPGKQNHPPPQIVPASLCSNCGTQGGQMHATSKGMLCNACYQFWRRTGIMRSRSSNHAKSDSHNARSQGKGKRKPPKGMTITQESLLVVSGLHSNAHLRPLDMDIINLKRHIQSNKQGISLDRFDLQAGINDVRGLEPNLKNNARWSNEELTLAVQSVRRYGKDFQAMADVLQNKTVSQCRNFFVNHRKRYDLERILEEYEAEQGIVRTDKKDGDQVPSPDSGGSSVPSPGTTQGNPPPLTKPSPVPTQAMFSNPVPYRNNVPSTGLSVPPPPLIKPTPMNYPVQVRLPTGVTSPPPQLVTQDSPYGPPHSGTTPPLRPTKV